MVLDVTCYHDWGLTELGLYWHWESHLEVVVRAHHCNWNVLRVQRVLGLGTGRASNKRWTVLNISYDCPNVYVCLFSDDLLDGLWFSTDVWWHLSLLVDIRLICHVNLGNAVFDHFWQNQFNQNDIRWLLYVLIGWIFVPDYFLIVYKFKSIQIYKSAIDCILIYIVVNHSKSSNSPFPEVSGYTVPGGLNAWRRVRHCPWGSRKPLVMADIAIENHHV